LLRHGSDKTLQVGYANHFYRSAHKFEQICRHRLRRQNVGYSNFSQPQSHLSFCVLLQYLVERRRVVTQLGKLDLRRGLAIDSTVDIFTFYVPHRHVYGEQWIKFMKDGVNATPLPTVNTTGYIDHAAFLGTINPDTNKIPKH